MKIRVKDITRIAIFSSLAAVLYIYLSFPFPFMPSFLKFNFSDVIALFGGFAFGPVIGCIIQIIKVIIKLMVDPTKTQFIGELSDLVLGIAFVLPAALIYKKKKNFKGAILGLSVSLVFHVICAALFNYFILIPFYTNVLGKEMVLSLCSMIPAIKDLKGTLILYGIIPFNVLRDIIIIIVTLILYKRLHRFILFIESKVEKKKVEQEE